MADTSATTELEAREAEAAEARARLSKTLDTLTSPETRLAVKGEVLGHVEGYKDELVKHADRYKDELLQKADEYKNELLQRADEYKDEALHRAEAYKDEALQRARAAGRETVHNVVDDLKTRAANNPMAVALIGAGVGWRLYKHPPITTLLVGAGAALLMRTPGRSLQDDRSSYRDPYDEEQPRGYVPGGVAGYGYPVEESAPGSGTAEQVTETVSRVGEYARHAASDAAARIADATERGRSALTSGAEETIDRVTGLAATVRRNPLLLALVGIAAGAVVARSIRSTETGDRLVSDGAHRLGRSAAEVGTRVGNVAGQAVETIGEVASAAASKMGDIAESIRTGVPEVLSGLTHAADRAPDEGPAERSEPTSLQPPPQTGKRRRQSPRSRYIPEASQRAGRELGQIAERYPVLLSTAGLILGAAAGAALRSTNAEDRYVGPASDALKQRAKQTVAEQFEHVAAAADKVISSAEEQLDRQEEDPQGQSEGGPGDRQPGPPRDRTEASGDVERNAVVVERAEDAAKAEVELKGRKRGKKSRTGQTSDERV